MRPTTAFEKMLSSAINVLVVLILCLPFLMLDMSSFSKKIMFVLVFFIYKLVFIFYNHDRPLGMILTNSYWKKSYPLKNQILHAVLYTLSFSTLLFWVFFPFDLFLINMLLIQLPTIILTGTTLHAYLSGKMLTVKKK